MVHPLLIKFIIIIYDYEKYKFKEIKENYLLTLTILCFAV